jgi:hypothetical protein
VAFDSAIVKNVSNESISDPEPAAGTDVEPNITAVAMKAVWNSI